MTRVLLVEENEADARYAEAMLKDAGQGQIEVTRVPRLSAALRRLGNESFDAIILDGGLVDTHGLDMLDLVQAALARIPIVLLSDQSGAVLEEQTIRRGVQEVVEKKQWTAELLARTVRRAIERKRAERNLAYLAQYDPLTALANRALFHDRLSHALGMAKRKKQELGVVLLGLDGFPELRATYGQEASDSLLTETADRLKQCMRDVDTVARLGGDEFTCLLEGIHCKADTEIVANRILNAMRAPYRAATQTIPVTISLGIAVFPLDGQETDQLLASAKIAMNLAQESGGGRYQIYQAS